MVAEFKNIFGTRIKYFISEYNFLKCGWNVHFY